MSASSTYKKVNKAGKFVRLAGKKLGIPSTTELAVLGITVLGGLLVVSELEKEHLEYAHYHLSGNGKLKRPVRIVYLSDLHEKSFGDDNYRLIEMIDDADPDLILMGGDMIRNHRQPEMEVAKLLCHRLAAKYPVYYGNGNHEQRLTPVEYEDYKECLKAMGVRYLDNSSESFRDDIVISGYNLSREQYLPVRPEEPEAESLTRAIGEIDGSKYNILLAHSPLFTDFYARSGVDLALCGHFHGGTIRVSDKVGLMTPQYQFFNDKVVGLKQKGAFSEIISSGLGTHSINIRINDKPQVVVVDIKN